MEQMTELEKQLKQNKNGTLKGLRETYLENVSHEVMPYRLTEENTPNFKSMRKLNFGCGNVPFKGWDNCDIQEEAPISFDFNEIPYMKLKNDYYDYILIRSVLESLDNPEKVLLELRNKCKNGAIIEILCPYFNNKGVWNDPTSKRGFTEVIFAVIANRHNERYINNEKKFELERLELMPTKNFGKYIPKRIREKLCPFISGIILHVYVKYKVKK